METAILILQDSLIQQKEQLSLAEKKYNLCVIKKQAGFNKRGIDNIKGFIAEIEEAISVLERAIGKPSDTDSNCNIHHISNSEVAVCVCQNPTHIVFDDGILRCDNFWLPIK